MVPRRIAALVVMVFACYQWDKVIATGDQQEQRLVTTTSNNPPQNLQSALYSIEERLRALDLVYVARSYSPRHQAWDGEHYTRRLDAIDSRVGRIEALVEMRLDKIQETLSANELKRTLAIDQMNRKVESLYDRLDNRMSYTENRMDLDVAKIQSSIESGFARLARTESESLLESDIETQLQELQRQLELVDVGQNATLARLSDMSARRCAGRPELNDAEELDEADGGTFVQSMESVTNKVNKMVDDFTHRTQSMEGLVKNAMSLANATRRELQDGLKTLGLRLNFHGKHNKDSALEYGSDALATLITKEFANIGARLTSNHDKLAASQHDFRQSCHRLQEKEQQLSDTVAKVLDGIIDLVQNRSLDMERQMSMFQEVLKHHNSQVLRTVGQASKSSSNGEHDGLIQILGKIQVLQEQVNATHISTEACPDSKIIADRIIASLKDNARAKVAKSRLFDENEETPDKPCDGEKANCRISNTRAERRKLGKEGNVLDILEEEHGDTLHYNVTVDGNEPEETKRRQTSEVITDNSTEGLNDYDFEKTDRSDQVYDEEVDLESDLTGDTSINKIKDLEESKSTIPTHVSESEDKPRTEIGTKANINSTLTEEESVRRGHRDESNGTETGRDESDPDFSPFWHRMRRANGTAAATPSAESDDETGGDGPRGGNNDLKSLDKAQLREDDTDYKNDDE